MPKNKIKKTYYHVIKLDDYTWSFIGRFITDNYSSRLIEIEQKNGRSDETQSFGEAYDMVCAYNDDIEKITITAELHDDSFNFILCNTKNIFHPTMVIEADCEPGYQKEQLVSFADNFLNIAGMIGGYGRAKTFFISFIAVLAYVIFNELFLQEDDSSFTVSLIYPLLFMLCFIAAEWLWIRLINKPSGILFTTDGMRLLENENKQRTRRILGMVSAFMTLTIIVILCLMSCMGW